MTLPHWNSVVRASRATVLVASLLQPLFAQQNSTSIFELTPVEEHFQPRPVPLPVGGSQSHVRLAGYVSEAISDSDSEMLFISPTGTIAARNPDRIAGAPTRAAVMPPAATQAPRRNPSIDVSPDTSQAGESAFLNPGWKPVQAAAAVSSGEAAANALQAQAAVQPAASPQSPEVPVAPPVADSAAPPKVSSGMLTAEADTPTQLLPATVEERRKQLEASDLADDVKATALAQYQQALEMLKRADEAAKKTAELKAERDKGPEFLAEIRGLLAKPADSAEPEVSPNASLSELQQLHLADAERLNEARKALDTWEQRAKLRAERKPQMPGLIDKTQQQLTELRKSQRAAAPEGEAPAVTEARRTEQQAFIILLQNQLDLYEVERTRYDALNELFPLQRDLLIRNRNLAEKRSEAWKEILLQAGRRETARQAAEARRKLQNAHPALRELAKGNSELVELRKSLQSLLATTRSRLDTISKTLDRLDADFTTVKDKEDRAGLTTAIGILLRNQRSHLPDDAQYRKERRRAEAEMSRLQLEQLPLEDQRDDLGDTATEAERIVASIDGIATHNGVDITDMTLSLLNDRKQYLDDLLADYDLCIRELAELDVRSGSLVETTQEFRSYIDERVLWIRSAAFVDAGTPGRAMQAIADLARHDRWYAVGQTLSGDIFASPLYSASLLLCVVLLVCVRYRLNKSGRASGQKQPDRSLIAAVKAAGVLLLNVVSSSVWPGVLWLVGRRLTTGVAGEFGVAIGHALQTTAVVFWSIEVFRQICRPAGFAELHLHWSSPAIRSLSRKLMMLMITGLPLVFAVSLIDHWEDGLWADSLGRILFVAGMCLLAVSIGRILKPDGPVLKHALQRDRNGWFYRSRKLWYPAAVVVPLLLAGMAIAGFQYTAEQLLIRVEMTFWLLVVLVIAFSVCMNWLISTRKALAMEQARARRAAALARNESPTSGVDASPAVKVEEPKTDFSLLSEQMLKLVRAAACVLFLSGSWLVWGEVLPALQVFNRVELWHTTTEMAEQIEISEGEFETRIATRLAPITLGSLLLAAGFLAISMVASRNIPGLLELSILKRLPMDHGGRNAITTLCRYALTLAGVLLASQTLGIGWSSVQWLLAALTVGLGFGLQEIFANFVSGLIILFERPVRIGDVVTIDGVSGSVSRIQIRATTITDFDRKEYIVPNKEFVTGRVLNWTLSDQTNRIQITVGVAYGTDTAVARSLLVETAVEHPRVLEDPMPMATFEAFGDSCLNLQLRCFLPSLENRLVTLTELHEAIDRKFKANGLEIAFPQRDIHIRSMTTAPIAVKAAVAEETNDAAANPENLKRAA
jgi:potassium efflux system protein